MELKLNFEGFEGEVVLRVATNIERLEIMDTLGMDLMKLGAQSKDDLATNLMTTKNIIQMLKLSESHYIKVNLKKGNKKYKSFDDLNNDSDCQAILMECATKCMMGLGEQTEKK